MATGIEGATDDVEETPGPAAEFPAVYGRVG
jgi:hypothetical protein